MAAPTVPSDVSADATATSEIVNQILAFLRYLEGWETFTPTWENSVSADPTIGNGLLTCRYQLVGKTLTPIYVIAVGTTTTFGSQGENYATLNLPESATVTGNKQRQTMPGVAVDASTGAVYGMHTQFVDDSHFRAYWSEDALSGSVRTDYWDGDQPFQKADGDLYLFGGRDLVVD